MSTNLAVAVARLSRRLCGALAAVAILAVGALVGLPGPLGALAPASAHDQVVSTTPSDGATLGTGRGSDAVTITMTEAPSTVGTEVVVSLQTITGAKAVVSQGQPTISGNTVTQALDTTRTGTYRVAYRIVSSDGHPVTGAFSFEVRATGAAAPTSDAAGSEAPTSATTSPTPGVAASATSSAQQPNTELNGSTPMVPIMLGVVSVLLLAGLAALMVRHRKPPTRLD